MTNFFVLFVLYYFHFTHPFYAPLSRPLLLSLLSDLCLLCLHPSNPSPTVMSFPLLSLNKIHILYCHLCSTSVSSPPWFVDLDNFSTDEREPVLVKEGQGVVLLCDPPNRDPCELNCYSLIRVKCYQNNMRNLREVAFSTLPQMKYNVKKMSLNKKLSFI